MQYLDAVTLPSRVDEDTYLLSYPPELEMQCYHHNNVYPYRIFPEKQLHTLSFAPLTFLYGGNGSGKSTLLNIIAEKLSLSHEAPSNRTPFFESYLQNVTCKLTFGKSVPRESRIITSDDVFDFLLNVRSVNGEIDRKREALFAEYDEARATPFRLRSLADYEELKRRNEARHKTRSAYVSRRLPKETGGRSNGESAYLYFCQQIGKNALYLLDEPENSLSASLQRELARFIEEAVRFYDCQFIISTHSPFLLALRGARIYDLDARPVAVRQWQELESIRIYRDFFEEHREDFSSPERKPL